MKTTINTFLANPYSASDDYSNFYDWFCTEKGLNKRMLAMVPKLKFLVEQGIVNGETNYVWFKNNALSSGSTYDDMRISSLSDNQFLGGFCPKNADGKCDFWFFDDKNSLVVQEFDDWSTFKKAVKTDKTLREKLIKHFNN